MIAVRLFAICIPHLWPCCTEDAKDVCACWSQKQMLFLCLPFLKGAKESTIWTGQCDASFVRQLDKSDASFECPTISMWVVCETVMRWSVQKRIISHYLRWRLARALFSRVRLCWHHVAHAALLRTLKSQLRKYTPLQLLPDVLPRTQPYFQRLVQICPPANKVPLSGEHSIKSSMVDLREDTFIGWLLGRHLRLCLCSGMYYARIIILWQTLQTRSPMLDCCFSCSPNRILHRALSASVLSVSASSTDGILTDQLIDSLSVFCGARLPNPSIAWCDPVPTHTGLRR